MNKQIEIKIQDKELLTSLEASMYEVNSRKEILSYMILNGADFSNNNFIKYQDEYQKFYMEYDMKKNLFERDYVFQQCPDAKSWSVDFLNETVIIEV